MNASQRSTILAAVLVLSLLAATTVLASGGMGSDQYRIPWSVLGGGGARMASSNFRMQATLAQALVGSASSAGHTLRAGFWVGGAGPVQVTHSLSAGWTLLAPNVETEPPTDAETALNEIEIPGSFASEVYRWLSETDAWDGHVRGLPFNNYPLELGQGYFFKTPEAGTWQRTGYPPATPVTVALNPVWTLIGVPLLPITMSAESLLQEATAQGGDCTEIYRWDASLGAWQGHVRGLPFGNFVISNNEGYFLKCAQATTYTPGGGP